MVREEIVDPRDMPHLEERLNPAQRAFRRKLLDLLVRAGRPVSAGEALAVAGVVAAEGGALLAALKEKGLLVTASNGEITGAYPVSVLPTPHRVRLADGREFFAMCAVDALGSGFEFNQGVTVASSCSQCGMPISVSLSGEKAASAEPESLQVLHVALDHYGDWAASC